jgi:hypothetical protein
LTNAKRYREYAADCARLSAVACDERSRAVLLHMACAWLRLAEWAERDGDTDPEQL